MRLSYTERAIRDLEALSPDVRQRIVEGVERFAASGAGDVRALKGQWRGRYRLRVGTWRVVFLTNRDMVVLRVLHRGQVYR